MDEYRDTTLHNADGTEDALRADMNDNAAPETADAAEPEILSAVADIASEEDETKDGAGPVRHRRPHRRRNIIIASVIAAVVVLAGGAGGYAYAASNVQKGVDAAQANALAVDQKLTAKIGDAQELLDGTEEEQVADAQTLADLSDAIDKAQAQTGVDDTGANRWLVWQEMDAQAAYDADSADASDAMSRLNKAMDAVTGSVDAKTLADAKQALQSTVDSADKTYADSDGKVQDNATRDNLKTALDAAKKVLSDDGVTDAKEYTDQKTTVDNAVKTVNDSIAAKEKADAEAKAQAEAEAAATASSAASSGGYSGGGSSYYGGSTGSGSTPSYSGNTSGFNNGYTAPSGNTSGSSSASTPAPDTGGDMSFDWVEGDADFNDNPWY
jgi:hypothetical protein